MSDYEKEDAFRLTVTSADNGDTLSQKSLLTLVTNYLNFTPSDDLINELKKRIQYNQYWSHVGYVLCMLKTTNDEEILTQCVDDLWNDDQKSCIPYYILARMYRENISHVSDIVSEHFIIYGLYKQASKLGHSRASNTLGVAWDNLKPRTEITMAKAMKYFLRAKEQGSLRALSNLGFMYKNGRGVEENYEQAITHFSQWIDDIGECDLKDYEKRVRKNHIHCLLATRQLKIAIEYINKYIRTFDEQDLTLNITL